MLPSIERLLILQDRDQKIRILRLELKNLPDERTSLDAKLAAGSTQLNAAKQRARDVELEKKKLEMEAQAKRDSIAKFRTQQFQTRKNEEFQALTNEIKRFEADIEKIEDREIELMEEAEKMKGDRLRSRKTARPDQGAHRPPDRRDRRQSSQPSKRNWPNSKPSGRN